MLRRALIRESMCAYLTPEVKLRANHIKCERSELHYIARQLQRVLGEWAARNQRPLYLSIRVISRKPTKHPDRNAERERGDCAQCKCGELSHGYCLTKLQTS